MKRLRWSPVVVVSLVSVLAVACSSAPAPASDSASSSPSTSASAPAADKEWTMPNKNPSATRYSGLTEINTEKVDRARLGPRLKEIYDPRPEKIIFIKGDPAVKYQDVIEAMDIARGSGVKVIGVPPKDAGAAPAAAGPGGSAR